MRASLDDGAGVTSPPPIDVTGVGEAWKLLSMSIAKLPSMAPEPRELTLTGEAGGSSAAAGAWLCASAVAVHCTVGTSEWICNAGDLIWAAETVAATAVATAGNEPTEKKDRCLERTGVRVAHTHYTLTRQHTN